MGVYSPTIAMANIPIIKAMNTPRQMRSFGRLHTHTTHEKNKHYIIANLHISAQEGNWQLYQVTVLVL